MWFVFQVLYYLQRLNYKKYDFKKLNLKIYNNAAKLIFPQQKFLEMEHDEITINNFFSFKLIYLKYIFLNKDSRIEILKFLVLKEEHESSDRCSSAICLSKITEFHCTEWCQFTHSVTKYLLSIFYFIGAVSPRLDAEVNFLS